MSSASTSHHSRSQQDVLGLLSLLPSQPDNSPAFEFACDFANVSTFDLSSVSSDLFLSDTALNESDENWLVQGCLLDPTTDFSGGGVLIPDMATQSTPQLDMSGGLSLSLDDDFLSQGSTTSLDAPPFEQPKIDSSTTSMFIPPATTTPSNTSTNSPSYAPNTSGFSTFTLNLNNQSSPDGSSSTSSGTKRKAASSPEDEVAAKDLKRQRNTMAARKYRQKRLDRIAELEQALADMTGERDDLRLKLARREAEADALREMLGKK